MPYALALSVALLTAPADVESYRADVERIVAHADGWLPNRVTPEELAEKRKELDALAQDAGRNPSEIGITVYGQPADKALLDALHEAGAERVIVRPEWVETDDEMCAQLEKIAAAVL